MAVMEHLLRRCNDAPMRREDGPHEHKSKQQDEEDDDKCEDDKYEDDTHDNVDDVEGEEEDDDKWEDDDGDEDGCKQRWSKRTRMECIDTWRS